MWTLTAVADMMMLRVVKVVLEFVVVGVVTVVVLMVALALVCVVIHSLFLCLFSIGKGVWCCSSMSFLCNPYVCISK